MTAVNLGMLLPSDCSLQSLCSSILPLLSMAGVDRHHYLAISQMDNLGDVTADVVVPSPYRPLPTTLWRGVMDENEQRHPLLTYRLKTRKARGGDICQNDDGTVFYKRISSDFVISILILRTLWGFDLYATRSATPNAQAAPRKRRRCSI